MKKSSAIIVSFMLGLLSTSVFAAGGMVKGPNVIAPDRYVYYPGTEVLDKDEVVHAVESTAGPSANID